MNWLASLNVAIILSIIAMLFFIGYAFLEALYFLGNWITGTAAAAAMTFVVIAIAGGWIWGLLAAVGGKRGGLIAVLVFNLLPALITLYDLIFYSPIPYGWSLVQIWVWATFLISVLAVALLVLQLRL